MHTMTLLCARCSLGISDHFTGEKTDAQDCSQNGLDPSSKLQTAWLSALTEALQCPQCGFSFTAHVFPEWLWTEKPKVTSVLVWPSVL